MASLLDLDDNGTDSLYGEFMPLDYAPYDGYKTEIPNPDREVGDLIHNDTCVNFKTTQKEIDDRIQAVKEAEETVKLVNDEYDEYDEDTMKYPLDYNKNIFDPYRYENKNMKYPQNIEYISTEENILLQEYMPTIYTENNDKYKLVNPNYYLEFTKILFENIIVGQEIKLEDKSYLCYFIFYETKRNISKTFSELSSNAMSSYEGKLFKTLMISIELNTKKIIESIFLSSDLENNEYQLIKPLNNKNEKINIFISNDRHNLYLINNPINIYSEFTSYKDESCKNPEKIMSDLEPLCKSKLDNTRNADLLKYSKILNIESFMYNKNLTDNDELKWYKVTSIWLPKCDAEIVKSEQSKNMPKYLLNSNNSLNDCRIIKKYKFIPNWLYKIIPKCFGFMYINEYLVNTYEYLA